jgi:hypothetical protein
MAQMNVGFAPSLVSSSSFSSVACGLSVSSSTRLRFVSGSSTLVT